MLAYGPNSNAEYLVFWGSQVGLLGGTPTGDCSSTGGLKEARNIESKWPCFPPAVSMQPFRAVVARPLVWWHPLNLLVDNCVKGCRQAKEGVLLSPADWPKWQCMHTLPLLFVLSHRCFHVFCDLCQGVFVSHHCVPLLTHSRKFLLNVCRTTLSDLKSAPTDRLQSYLLLRRTSTALSLTPAPL